MHASQSISIIKPDDWHVHFRDNDILQYTVPATAHHFARALVMPNLKPPLVTAQSIEAYRDRILAHVPPEISFTPYMTLYLNESVTPDELTKALNFPWMMGAKLYPANVTTHSEDGARSITALYPLFEILQNHDAVLQIHGEVNYGDIFDREALFIQNELIPITRNFPKLRIVLEHISTKAAVDFIKASPDNIAATITVHHLLYHRNHLLAGGLHPHYYCLPILKRESDQKALQDAATSGHPKFFAGTDSAPHSQTAKESACGCAGIYSAPCALPLYAQVFDALGRLDRLNHFTSVFGATFYQCPVNREHIQLIKEPHAVPSAYPYNAHEQVIPLAAGQMLEWSVHE